MNKMTLSYYVALAAYVLQFVLLGLGSFLSDNAQFDTLYQVAIGLTWTFIKGIPWLVLIPAFLMKSKNTMAWMCYICMVYFIIWILAAFSADPYGIASFGVLLTTVQFVAAALYTRLSKRQAAENQAS